MVEVEGEPVADFVVLAEARATDLNEGTYSVYAQQEIKYRLHVPDKATPEHRVPLVIWLSDDGFSSTDGLDLWKDRLGNEAAIAVLDAPYRETRRTSASADAGSGPIRFRPISAAWSGPWK